MYISVENYKGMYLNGKDAEALRDEIEKLRREIAKVKNKLESPANSYNVRMLSADADAVNVYKGYLSCAIEYLSDISGNSPEYTEEEKASMVFDSAVGDISCITLTAGRYLQNKYELVLTDDKAILTELHLDEEAVSREINIIAARETIRSMHFGEWRESYLPEHYGCTLNEPTRWQLRVDYLSGSAPRFFDGVGVFPYNFSSLARLFGADVV